MIIKKTQFSISYEQAIEIRIEFPLAILSEYNGPENLDETWDDHMMYLIHNALNDHGAYIKHSKILDYLISINNEEIFIYELQLIIRPPGFDFYCIVENLKNYQRGVCIKKNPHTIALKLSMQIQNA